MEIKRDVTKPRKKGGEQLVGCFSLWLNSQQDIRRTVQISRQRRAERELTTELPQTTAQPETCTVHSTAVESPPILLCCLVRLLCAEHCSIAGGLDSARYQKGTFYENASNQRLFLPARSASRVVDGNLAIPTPLTP